MSNRFYGVLVALLITLLVFPAARGQIIDDEYNAADLAAGVTAYSGPLNGTADIDRFLARQVGLVGFNWQVFAGVRAGQPIWCSTKMRLSDMVREKFAKLMVQYKFLCRDHFKGTARNFRLAFGPLEQQMMSFTEPYVGMSNASVPAMLWYDAMFGAGWFPAKSTTVLTVKATHPRSLGCGSVLAPQLATDMRVLEWSFCKHVLYGEQYSVVVAIMLRRPQEQVLYITYSGSGMFQIIPLEVLIQELTELLKNVRYVRPES